MGKLITFGTFSRDIFYTEEVHPIPMSEYPIEWWENIKTEKIKFHDGQEGKNAKACPSVVEIYQEGYVIPAPTDYKIKVTPTGEFFWEAAFTFRRDMDGGSSDKDDIEYHYNDQLVHHLPEDFDTKMIIKINLPWKVFTPNGYSIRIMKMPFTSNKNWEPTYGVLRTDRNHHLNFQTNIKTDTEEVFINQGEPLALIVPYKREEFKSNIVDLNDKNEHSIKYHKHYLKTYGKYKTNFRKDYWSDK